MPFKAQRPAPPPPASAKQQSKRNNINSGFTSFTSNDSNNNRQNTLFSWPTVIRPSAANNNNNNTSSNQIKKKPPPRPAPPRNYQASRKAGNPVPSLPPDLLADIFSVPQQRSTQKRPLSHPSSHASFQSVGSVFKASNSSSNFSSSSSSSRSSKKYPAPVPSKNKEMSLIDFDTPVGTAHLTPSDTLALASAVNRHKNLIDWDATPKPTGNMLSKSSPFDLPDGSNQFKSTSMANLSSIMSGPAPGVIGQQATSGPVPGYVHQQATNFMSGPAPGIIRQQATSLSAQHKDTVINWGMNGVKEQISPREFSPPEPKFPPPPPPPTADKEIFGFDEEQEWQHSPVLEVCQVLFNFTAEKDGDISLRVGDRVEVETKQNTDWWTGRCNGRRGIFPSSFVGPEESTPSDTAQLALGSESSSGCFAKALYTFAAEQPTDLAFQEGDTVQVLYRINQDWLYGSCKGKKGQFPAGFVSKIGSEQTLCRALYTFQAENADELSLSEGDKIVVTEQSGTDWWKGHLESDSRKRVGLFPASFVESCS